jgi:hypothetical protein
MSKIDKKLIKCTINPGEIIRSISSKKYYVQIEDDNSFLGISRLKSYLSEVYDLSLIEYYNIVVYGDINYSHKCKNCNKDVTYFKYKFHQGYSDFCNNSCSTSYYNKVNNPAWGEEARKKISESQSKLLKERSSRGENPFQNPEFIKSNAIKSSERLKRLASEGKHLWQQDHYKQVLSKRLTARNLELSKLGENNLQKPEASSNSIRSRYKNRFKYTSSIIDVYLFLNKSNNLVKVGVSNDYLERWYEQTKGNNLFTRSHVVFKGDPDSSCYLELEIKRKFCLKGTETFEYHKLKEVLNFIREFNSNH